MQFINLTPHPVVVQNGSLKITFAKDYTVPTARVEQQTEAKKVAFEVAPGMVIDIPVTAVVRSKVYNLPEPKEGVIYIVSSMVAAHVMRPDIVAPITDNSCERDERGRVISVPGFNTYAAVEAATEANGEEVSNERLQQLLTLNSN